MSRSMAGRNRFALLAFAGVLAMPGSAFGQSYSPISDDDPRAVTVTAQDVEASNQKAGAAFSALASMWTRELDRVGASFVVPQLVRYRGAVRTGCGVMGPSNASYCYDNNTI